MTFTADYHIHSRYSDGRATLKENVEAALTRGLCALALTDHGPNHLRGGLRRREIPQMIKEASNLKSTYAGRIDVKLGLETNIVGMDGSTDLPDEYKDVFEVVGLGYHLSALGKDTRSNLFLHGKMHLWKSRCQARMTDMLMAAMENNTISYLVHPGLHTGPLDWQRLARACAKHNVAIELSARRGHLCLDCEDVRLMRDCGAVFVVNSDAHKTEEIGAFDPVLGLIERAQLTYHDIVNAQGFDRPRPYGL